MYGTARSQDGMIAQVVHALADAGDARFCITWSWHPHLDRRLLRLLGVLGMYRPRLLILNAGIHDLVPNILLPALVDTYDAIASLCRSFRSTQCIWQAATFTNFTEVDATIGKHLRLGPYIAAFNAAVEQVWRKAPLPLLWMDSGSLTLDPRILRTISAGQPPLLRPSRFIKPHCDALASLPAGRAKLHSSGRVAQVAPSHACQQVTCARPPSDGSTSD